ncbi:hypothetical protein Tco_1280493 [Tanacetum coccineum]
MLAICNVDEPMAFKAPKTSSQIKKKDLKGKKPGVKSIQRKQIPDLSKLVKDVNFDTMELDSPEDDQPFIVLNDEEEEVHAEPNIKIEDTLVPVCNTLNSVRSAEGSNGVTY